METGLVPSSTAGAARFGGGSKPVDIVQEWTRKVARLPGWRRDDGQDMVEYALLVGLLSVFALAVIVLVGPSLVDTFQTVVNGLGLA